MGTEGPIEVPHTFTLEAERLRIYEREARIKAEDNIRNWGIQSRRTLLLCIQEELGELTQATLEAEAEGGDWVRQYEELNDLWALLYQFGDRLIRDEYQLPRDNDARGG